MNQLSTDLLDRIETLLRTAEANLLAQTGGVNVCQLSKVGQSTGSAKYHEGRLVALREARRVLLSPAGATAQQITPLIERWQANLAMQQRRSQPAPAWLDYARGGVAALTDLLHEP